MGRCMRGRYRRLLFSPTAPASGPLRCRKSSAKTRAKIMGTFPSYRRNQVGVTSTIAKTMYYAWTIKSIMMVCPDRGVTPGIRALGIRALCPVSRTDEQRGIPLFDVAQLSRV